MMQATTAWPDKFIYVCSATQGAAVNLAPVVQAGIERIARVHILRGGGAAGADLGQARKPHDDLRRAILGIAKRAGVKIDIAPPQDGDTAEPDDWGRALAEVRKRASSEGLPVVFNLVGGTKAMAIGGMLGCADSEAGPVNLLFSDARLRPCFLTAQGRLALPAQRELSLAEYIDGYGLKEEDRAHRESWASFCAEQHAALDAFAQFLCENPGFIWHLNDFSHKFPFGPRGQVSLPAEIGWPDRFPDALVQGLAALTEILDFEMNAFGIAIPARGFAWKFIFEGGWLEAILFNHACEFFKGRNDVEVVANLKLRDLDEQKTLTEIDVAILSGSQLHVLEAKSGSHRNGDDWLRQMLQLRARLCGPHARIAVFNPSPHDKLLDLLARAGRSNIELMTGSKTGLVVRLNDMLKAIAPSA